MLPPVRIELRTSVIPIWCSPWVNLACARKWIFCLCATWVLDFVRLNGVWHQTRMAEPQFNSQKTIKSCCLSFFTSRSKTYNVNIANFVEFVRTLNPGSSVWKPTNLKVSIIHAPYFFVILSFGKKSSIRKPC